MGRTSKFTFPLPGRKQKPSPPTPTSTSVAGTLSKAQKTLGSGDISIDSPTWPNDPSKQWDTRSNSGISISISESTASHLHETASGRPDRDDVRSRGGERRGRWEDESAIIPRDLVGPGMRGDRGAGPATTDMVTDASSLRRRESSSTIVSYYDKSKLPLSISQQTSASAIARGLPRKASSILDVDGTRSAPAKAKAKKKPSRLDLSYLLPKSRSPKHLTPSPDAPKGLVLGHDLITRSPSLMSISPDIGPLPIESRSENRNTDNRRPEQFSPADSTDRARARAAASTANLPNLYDHYEQRSFRDIGSAGLGTTATEPASGSYAHPLPTITSTNDYLSPSFSSAHRVPSSAKSASASVLSGADTPLTAVVTPSSLVSLPADCAASISSRHTRTSKASKRTDHSLVEFDLHQNSVLSLSSDSEDDYSEAPKQFTPAPQRPSRDWSLSPTSPNSLGLPHASMPSPVSVDRVNAPPSDRSTFSDSHLRETDATVVSAASIQPRISARTSSLSVSSSATKNAPSRRSQSRLSLASTATATSAVPGASPNPSPRDGINYGIHEARAVSVTASRSPSRPSQGRQPPPRRASQTSLTSDFPPRCLSPVSIDSYLHSPHKPLSLDNVSIRSGRSMISVGSGTSIGSRRSSYQTGGSSGRMMAVTRQEEMLLAALRMKRARMRENIMTEPEGGNESTSDESPTHNLPLPPFRRDQPPLGRAPDQPLPQPPKTRSSLDRNALASRHASRLTSASSNRLAPLHEMPQTITAGNGQQQRGPISARSAPVRLGTSPKQSAGELERGQILLYYDRPAENMDDFDAAEPSPDLSDFMDYDDENSDDLPLQTPSEPEPSSSSRSRKLHRPPRLSLSVITQGNAAAQEMLVNTLARSTDSESLSSRSTPCKPHGEDVHVRIVEDAADDGAPDDEIAGIPRPDSPISPAGPLPIATPLPRKKQVRLSAVGYVPGFEAGLWAHDG